MITVGIDSGNQNTKAVILANGEVLAKAAVTTEFDAVGAAERVLDEALMQAGLARADVDAVAATGAGRETVPGASAVFNEISSAVKGTLHVYPAARLVVDIGAESCRAIRLTEKGAVSNYEINDKCASGAGTFIEAMARALEISVDEIGGYSMRHTKEVPMNAQCVVFAESEVISLIHQREKVEDIAWAIHLGISNRINSIIRRVGLEDNVILIGGPGRNIGLVQCLQNEVGKKIFVPEDPEYVSALGAALGAAQA